MRGLLLWLLRQLNRLGRGLAAWSQRMQVRLTMEDAATEDVSQRQPGEPPADWLARVQQASQPPDHWQAYVQAKLGEDAPMQSFSVAPDDSRLRETSVSASPLPIKSPAAAALSAVRYTAETPSEASSVDDALDAKSESDEELPASSRQAQSWRVQSPRSQRDTTPHQYASSAAPNKSQQPTPSPMTPDTSPRRRVPEHLRWRIQRMVRDAVPPTYQTPPDSRPSTGHDAKSQAASSMTPPAEYPAVYQSPAHSTPDTQFPATVTRSADASIYKERAYKEEATRRPSSVAYSQQGTASSPDEAPPYRVPTSARQHDPSTYATPTLTQSGESVHPARQQSPRRESSQPYQAPRRATAPPEHTPQYRTPPDRTAPEASVQFDGQRHDANRASSSYVPLTASRRTDTPFEMLESSDAVPAPDMPAPSPRWAPLMPERQPAPDVRRDRLKQRHQRRLDAEQRGEL